MQAHQRITEISGKPGKVWGNMFVPSRGSITAKITGDVLQTTVQSGMEKTNSWVRIQNIDSAEMIEAPEYTLFALGIFLVLLALGWIGSSPLFGLMVLALGIACIVYAFINKRRLLVIYSHRYTVPIFMNKTSASYQQFAEHVMVLARHLNTLPATPQANRSANSKPPTQQATGARPAIQ